MARNLQAKLPNSDTMKVYDINEANLQRFANDTKALSSGAAVQAVANVREAAEDSVRIYVFLCYIPRSLCDEFVLSMI